MAKYCNIFLAIITEKKSNKRKYEKIGLHGPHQWFLCKKSMETLDHLLDNCLFSSSLWNKGEVLFWCSRGSKGRPNLTLKNQLQDPFSKIIVNRIWCIFLSFVVWETWKECNLVTFREVSCTDKKVWDSIWLEILETVWLGSWNEEDFRAHRKELLILKYWGIDGPMQC